MNLNSANVPSWSISIFPGRQLNFDSGFGVYAWGQIKPLPKFRTTVFEFETSYNALVNFNFDANSAPVPCEILCSLSSNTLFQRKYT